MIASARRAIGVVAGQQREPGQHADHRAVAGGHRGVGAGLGAGDQVGGVVGGEEIAAAVRVPVMPVEHADPVARLRQIGGVAGRLVQRQRGAAQIGVVVDAGRMARPPVAPAMAQPPVRRRSCCRATKAKARCGQRDPIRPVERRARHRRARRSSARSSRPAPCRRARAAPAARAPRAAARGTRASSASVAASARPGVPSRLRIVWPSQLPPAVTS